MPHNFKTTAFQGSLTKLFEECWEYMPDAQAHLNAHHWLAAQPGIPKNVLPLRKFAPAHTLRGSLVPIGNVEFMPADNEPLADLYVRWKQGNNPSVAIGDLLRSGGLTSSWCCDVVPRPLGFGFRGITSTYRDNGLKLAHICDAARNISAVTGINSITLRFIRSLSPLNVFLFPSHKKVVFNLISTNSGWLPKQKDWAEEEFIRGLARGWLIEKLTLATGTNVTSFLACFGSCLDAPPNWAELADKTIVSIVPKSTGSTLTPKTSKKRSTGNSAKTNQALACPKVSRANAVSAQDAVDILRQWRAQCPNARQLDGGNNNNPAAWFHFKVDGYISPRDDFQSRHGVFIVGDRYNGVVNFHGDTKTDKIDEFIDLMDTADDYRDVLRPSATHESRNRVPTNGTVGPKFALQGYKAIVEGFFLYHD